jgi:hypothetical protein
VLEIAEGLRLAGQWLGKLVLAAEQVRGLTDHEPEDVPREDGAGGGHVPRVWRRGRFCWCSPGPARPTPVRVRGRHARRTAADQRAAC